MRRRGITALRAPSVTHCKRCRPAIAQCLRQLLGKLRPDLAKFESSTLAPPTVMERIFYCGAGWCAWEDLEMDGAPKQANLRSWHSQGQHDSAWGALSIDTASRQTFAHLQKTAHAAEKTTGFTFPKKKRCDRWGQGQRNVWDRYGDSSSAASASAEESGRQGTQGKHEGKWKDWGPWPTSAEGRPAQSSSSCTMQPANLGENPWTNWTKEVQATRPEYNDEFRSSSWQARAGGTDAWRQGWSLSSSEWDRSLSWSVPTSANLTEPDHETDSEWRKDRKWHATGWRKIHRGLSLRELSPPHTDPEDDRQVDAVLPIGSTSKTWNTAQDQGFWTEADPSNTGSTASASQSMLSTHWRPRLHAGRDVSSNAGDTYYWSKTGTHWWDLTAGRRCFEDSSRTSAQALASRGGSS